MSCLCLSRELINLLSARILSALQSLLHSNFAYQVFQRRSIPITCSNSMDFQNCSDSPAYCCSLAKIIVKTHFSSRPAWIHPGINPFIHLSICLDSHSAKWQTVCPSVIRSVNASFLSHRSIMGKQYPHMESEVNHKLAAEVWVTQREGYDELIYPLRWEESSAACLAPFVFFNAFPLPLPRPLVYIFKDGLLWKRCHLQKWS